MGDESGKQRWRLGYWVTVEADGYDATDAHIVAEYATGWPGDGSPPHEPVEVSVERGDRTHSAAIRRSTLLMAHPVDPPTPTPQEQGEQKP